MALRDYAPITNMASLILLPFAFFPAGSQDYGSVTSEHHVLWSWLQLLFLAAFLTHKLNDFVLYGHVGLQRVANLQAMDIWCAPCKPKLVLFMSLHSSPSFHPQKCKTFYAITKQ